MPLKTRKLRISKLEEHDRDDDLRSTTPAQRLAMMWQLTLDAWAAKGEPIAETAFRRDVVQVIRLNDK